MTQWPSFLPIFEFCRCIIKINNYVEVSWKLGQNCGLYNGSKTPGQNKSHASETCLNHRGLNFGQKCMLKLHNSIFYKTSRMSSPCLIDKAKTFGSSYRLVHLGHFNTQFWPNSKLLWFQQQQKKKQWQIILWRLSASSNGWGQSSWHWE